MMIVNRTAEAKLVETLTEIRDSSERWTAIAFHLDRLSEQYRSEYHMKIATNMVHDLLQNAAGGLYVGADGGMVLLCEDMSALMINKVTFQLRYLCMDDPLAYGDDGQENPEFCTVYYLEREWQACMTFATKRMTQQARGKQQMQVVESMQRVLFSAARLATIERDLVQLDITPATRRQPVCALMPNGQVKKLFDELYVNMGHLSRLLKTDIDFNSNKALFKYMTNLLDARVLAMLKTNPQKQLSQPLSININVDTLHSPMFTELDNALSSAQKVAVVFEVPVTDVFADMAAFNYARDQVQKMGYRICIDGLTTQSMQHVNREKLKADLLKMQWNADSVNDLSKPENKQVAAAIQSCGPSRVILCRCDSKAAVDYGQAMGLSLFQGRHLDGLFNPQMAMQN